MEYQYDYIVFIGRFQPPHLAHIEIIKQALQLAEHVVVLIGSANQPRTIKNPFHFEERSEMIYSSLPQELQSRVKTCAIKDIAYNDQAWVQQIQKTVDFVTHCSANIGIIGYTKDESSYYLSLFPQWKQIEVSNINDLHATDIRKAYFTSNGDDFDISIGRNLPTGIHDWLRAFMLRPEYDQLVREYEFIAKYKSAWDAAPYPPTFVTVDAVVIQSGHVLLVRRRAEPGKGLFAIPGGFVNQNESLVDAAIRELREETKIKVPSPVLSGSIKATFVADAPSRSLRGRTISHVYGIELQPGPLPKVKGSDDAEKATWVPLNVFDKLEDQMFEDHFHLVRKILGMMK